MRDEEKVQAVVEAVKSGSVATASYAQLVTYSSWLALPGSNRLANGTANYEEVSKVVHLHLMRSVIEAFERRSKVMGWLTLVFAATTIAVMLLPYFIAPNPSSAANQAPTAALAQPQARTSQDQAQSMATTQDHPVPTEQEVSATMRQSATQKP